MSISDLDVVRYRTSGWNAIGLFDEALKDPLVSKMHSFCNAVHRKQSSRLQQSKNHRKFCGETVSYSYMLSGKRFNFLIQMQGGWNPVYGLMVWTSDWLFKVNHSKLRHFDQNNIFIKNADAMEKDLLLLKLFGDLDVKF